MSLGNDCLQLRNAYFNKKLKNRKNKVNSNSKICRNHLNAVSSFYQKKKLKYSLATSGSCSCKGYINRTQVLSKDQQKFEHRFQWLYQVLQ